MKYFIDTNIFLRALTKDSHKQYQHCVQLLEVVREGKIKAYTANIVLAESSWTLLSFYKFPKKKVVQALKATANLKNLRIVDSYNLVYALNLYENNNVKFIDSLIASLEPVKEQNMAVVSYDKDFDKLGVERKEPLDILPPN